MARSTKAKSSMQTFAVYMMAASAFVMLVFVGAALWYDENAIEPFGIRPSMVSFMTASYLPVVGATAAGFRNFVFNMAIGPGGASPSRIPLTGAKILYGIAIFGQFVALGVIVLVAFGRDEAQAKWLVGGGAAIWAATCGSIFDKFFVQYAKAGGVSAKLPD